MRLIIKLLRPFSKIVGKSELSINFTGDTLDNLIEELINRYPQLKTEFYTKNDELTDLICIFVNDKPISALKGINTNLKNNDNVLFFIPLSGG